MTLPELYFRIRENGALVFRVDAENRHGRLDLEPLAFANVRNGEIRAQGGREITEAEKGAITAWIAERARVLAEQEGAQVARAIEEMNAAAHWAQTKASDVEIEAAAADLLMAMHDLRSVIVRRQSDIAARD